MLEDDLSIRAFPEFQDTAALNVNRLLRIGQALSIPPHPTLLDGAFDLCMADTEIRMYTEFQER